MTKHRTSLANLRPSDVDPKAVFDLAREIERAEAFAACREGFRAWARAGFPGDDPFSIFRASAVSGNAREEPSAAASGGAEQEYRVTLAVRKERGP